MRRRAVTRTVCVARTPKLQALIDSIANGRVAATGILLVSVSLALEWPAIYSDQVLKISMDITPVHRVEHQSRFNVQVFDRALDGNIRLRRPIAAVIKTVNRLLTAAR